MSGQLQTIPARHGVATFVPRGRTIKIINTYGRQVVSTWAFGLHAPPEEGDDEEEIPEVEGDIGEEAEELKGQAGTEKGKESEIPKQEVAKNEKKPEEGQEATEEAEDPPEQAPETPPNEKSTENTSVISESKDDAKKPEKRTWSSYLPSMPYRSKGKSDTTASQPKPKNEKEEKAQKEAASKKWSSYIPTGQGFSSYVPNVQIPDSNTVISAFKASHYRDPNKSYAEQLYDFSKTPVGAGTIAAATGSGTASSLYAAYSAYTKMNPFKADQPPMEYLSLPHTRTSTHHLVPEVNDTLLSNLRSPIMTLIEDTTPGAHDTLTAACDVHQYKGLGVENAEEHGSCAENLVLALKELNEKAGLKGTKAVGADVTVNNAPTPLHLFMNMRVSLPQNAQDAGVGAKGATLSVEEPQGKKRSYVRFRAERDMVIVMSACPMEVGKQNGGKCMAANFMVEEASEEDLASSISSLKKPKSKKEDVKKEEKAQGAEVKKPMPGRPRGGPAKIQAVRESAEAAGRRDSAIEPSKEKEKTGEETPKPKKKPKKLERRGTSAAKSESP